MFPIVCRPHSGLQKISNNYYVGINYFFSLMNNDRFMKSQKTSLSVIPAEAGIQPIQALTKTLDSGFHRSDDFLRVHQS